MNLASEQIGQLRAEKIQRRLPAFRLEADFLIEPGERLALLGQSGSGKTTLLRMIAGLEKIEAGKLTLGEFDITRLPPQRREIGVLFQDYALFPALSVLENAAFGLKMRRVARSVREELALSWLKRVGLESRAHGSIARLSGGERQRVAFVRAVVWKPKLLLLDEPFSALDPGLRQTLRHELVELHKLHPVPLLLVTHDQADIDTVATDQLRVEILPGGTDLRQVRRATHKS